MINTKTDRNKNYIQLFLCKKQKYLDDKRYIEGKRQVKKDIMQASNDIVSQLFIIGFIMVQCRKLLEKILHVVLG